MGKSKDSIDFGSMRIRKLFRRLFVPTLLGMVFSIIFIITDGVFVGRGIGSDALASVNVTAPIFLVNTSFALMFGIGASVVASIHLSQNNRKAARINITQSIGITILASGLLSTLIMLNLEPVARLLGASDRLLPLALEYMYWFVPYLSFSAILTAGMFCIRLDKAPQYAMSCNIIAASINMFLDYYFIYRLGWGMFGAAMATTLGYIVGAVMVLVYMFMPSHPLHFIRIKASLNSLKLTVRNIGYMCRMGASSFLSQLSVAIMMFVGNYVFMKYMGEDGVAAYSITCYLFPIIFMVYNAIAQSTQPILSYNYGAGLLNRVHAAFRLSLYIAIASGLLVFTAFQFCSPWIVSLFLDDSNAAYSIAVNGLPIFATGYVCFGINMVSIGYYQSLERDRIANLLTVLRGFLFIIVCFWFLPQWWGTTGIWLAVPTAELLTFLCIVFVYHRKRLAEKS